MKEENLSHLNHHGISCLEHIFARETQENLAINQKLFSWSTNSERGIPDRELICNDGALWLMLGRQGELSACFQEVRRHLLFLQDMFYSLTQTDPTDTFLIDYTVCYLLLNWHLNWIVIVILKSSFVAWCSFQIDASQKQCEARTKFQKFHNENWNITFFSTMHSMIY